ncbi:MAG: hypothetical protein GY851_00985 [bacterium]|nr:hypothetical protein [bacterium]
MTARQPQAVADIVAMGAVFPAPNPGSMALPPAAGVESHAAYLCDEPMGKGIVPPNKLRRLGPVQLLALTATGLALRNLDPPIEFGARSAMMVGTGLGELGHTTAFLDAMFTKSPFEMKPTHFINSVHNSLASEAAIVHGFRGENYTLTHNAISFEIALQEGLRVLRAGRADHALVCGADRLTSFGVEAGRRLGWWRSPGSSLDPMQETSPVNGTLPGEGAAALLLVAPGTCEGHARVGRIAAVAARPLAGQDATALDSADETDFLGRVLASAGLSLGDVDLVLYGANGDADLDAAYRRVDDRLADTVPNAGVFKHECGDFMTASALGVALAVDAVRDGQVPPAVRCIRPGTTESLVRTALVYSLSRAGYHSACVTTA